MTAALFSTCISRTFSVDHQGLIYLQKIFWIWMAFVPF
jgi:hypothetical protein